MALEVFASLPLAVLSFGARKGVRADELMRAGGLSSEALADRDATVPYESLPRMWELILERFPDEPLGVEYAQTLDYSIGGVVAYVCRHSRTLGDSLDAYLRFSRLLDPHLSVSVERIGDACRTTLSHEARVEAMIEPIEMMLITFLRFTRQWTGQALPVTEVSFRHPQKHPREHYLAPEIFGDVALRFGASYTGVTFPGELLETPFEAADPTIRRYLAAHCEHLLAEAELMEEDDALDLRVRQRIDERLLRGEVDIDGVAADLAMSTRTLQRGLRQAGTSFREAVDEVRRTRALQLLRQPSLSVQEIAFMLGYAEPRNFYRSFRRWTEHTPASYRREVLGAS